jgi:CHASE2 domain-containing sensor protein
MKVKKIESKYLKSDFLVELIVSVLAGLSGIIWMAIFTSETTILDIRTTMRSKYVQTGGPADKKTDLLDKNIVVVTIPENVMIRYERSGDNRITPRNYLAQLVDRVSYYKPRMIVLDYLFDHPSKKEEDTELLKSIKKAGNVITGYEQIPTIHGFSTVITDSLKEFMEASAGAGYLNMVRDKDNVIRYYEYSRDGDASLAHRVVAGYYGLPHKKYRLSEDNYEAVLNVPKESKVFFAKKGIEHIYAEKTMINYRAPLKESFVIYDNSDDLMKPFPNPVIADKIMGRIVIIGDGTYKSDLHKTPFSDTDKADSPADTPGVLIQAMAIKNLIDADFVTQTPAAVQFLLILAAALITFLISYYSRFMRAVYFTFIAMAVYWLIVFAGYIAWSWWMPIVSPSITMFIVCLFTLIFRIAFSEKDNIDADDNLTRNVPPRVIEKFEEDHPESIFTSKDEDLILLACWPKNIPSISADNTPAKINEFLNYYYRTIREVVFAFDGTFNRLPLSGVLAFWNAPLRDDKAAEKAVNAADEIIDHIELINQKGRRLFKNYRAISIDIILHSGRALVGYIGPEHYRDYTAIGDSVNDAFALAQHFAKDEVSGVIATSAFREKSTQDHFYEGTVLIENWTLYKVKTGF